MQKRRAPAVLSGWLAVAVLLAGCASGQDYSGPIGSFQQSVEASSSALGSYYLEMNALERELYLNDRLYDANLKVEAADAQGPTPLLHDVFTPESIAARLDALRLIGVYANRLGELAGSEAPANFAANAQALGTNLSSLADRFKGLKDSTAASYIGPVSTIIGVVGQMYLEAKRDEMIKKAVTDGAPKVRDVLALLQNDFTDVLGPQRLTGAKDALATATLYYNDHRRRLSFAERQAILDDIGRRVDRLNLVLSEDPVGLIASIGDAHEALVRFSQSADQVADFATLRARLEVLQQRVITIVEAVQTLRALHTAS